MESMGLTTQILLSLGAGAALLVCLFLIAAYGPEAISLFVILVFFAVQTFFGVVIDKITGANGFSSSPVMLMPQAHNSGMISAVIFVWLLLSAVVFIILRLCQRFLY
jgi:hypothetical protein